jgi:hypothetical protein
MSDTATTQWSVCLLLALSGQTSRASVVINLKTAKAIGTTVPRHYSNALTR